MIFNHPFAKNCNEEESGLSLLSPDRKSWKPGFKKKPVAESVAKIVAITLAITAGASVYATDKGGTIHDFTSTVPFEVDGASGDSFTATGSSTNANGRFVVFSSFASNLVPNDTNGLEDVFLLDRQTNEIQLVSRAPDGSPGNGASSGAVISADGRSVAFVTSATNLFNDNNGSVQDVVVFRTSDSTIEVANLTDPGEQGQFLSSNPSLSADGRFVAFDSASALVSEAVDGSRGVYVRDTRNGTTQLLSRTPGGAFPNEESTDPVISEDGSFVAFVSRATDIAPGAGSVANIYYINRNTLVTQLVTTGGDADSTAPALSGNAEVVGFESQATNLAANDFNGASDAFIWTAATDTIELVSRAPSGDSGNGASFDVSLNEDASLVLYRSQASDLVAGDTNGFDDIFLLNRNTGTTTRVNVAEDGTQADAPSFTPGLSADGNTVVFASTATTLSDVNAANNPFIFVRNLQMVVEQPSVVSSILPSSRSAQVNQTVTFFATMIASEIGNNCGIGLASPIDAAVSFQRTDPLTNELIGNPDEGAFLQPGVPMSYQVSITAFAPLSPTEVEFTFVCDTGQPAPVLVGTNTLLFSASVDPVPDIVALSATIANDGIVRIPDSANFGIFSAANVNLGAGANITASLSIAGEPIEEALLCPTVFETGQCISPPSQTTSLFLGPNGTSSFGVFVRNPTTIPFRPDLNRVFLVFTDDNGVVRGRTSVAVIAP